MLRLNQKTISWTYTTLIWVLFIGMMWSRAMLSIGVVVLPVFTLLVHLKKIKIVFKQRSWVWSMVLMFLIAVVSLIWSTDPSEAMPSLMNKTMLVFIPIGLLGAPLKNLQWTLKTLFGIAVIHLIVMVGVGVEYISNPEQWIAWYNQMGTMPVAKYNDHIRFTLSLILLNVIWMRTVLTKPLLVFHRFWKTSAIIFAGISVLFIHLLASKSGIVLLYLSLILWILFLIPQWKAKLIVFIGAVLLLIFMFQWSPTFRKKVDMVKYQWDLFQESGTLDYNNSDQGRVISYKVAWQTLQESPMLGVGLGAELKEMKQHYQERYPEIPEDRYIVPHNQFLFSFLSFGCILGAFYVLLLAIPVFYKKTKVNKLELLVLFVIFASFIPEATLEAQFGMFIVVFYLSWLRFVESKSIHFE